MHYIKSLFKSYITIVFAALLVYLSISTGCADQDLISLFPLDNYDQTISTWLKPSDPNYDKPIMNSEIQQKRFASFYNHNFGSTSPWNADYIKQILKQAPPNDLKTVEQEMVDSFSNQNKPDNEINYGENFRPYTQDWLTAIANTINFSQLDGLTYQANHRGIAITNLEARMLPTDDVSFYSYKLAGQGYPFDNLQISALWAGTPVYILATTNDQAWSLVVTPDYIGWVKSSGIARTDSLFVDMWSVAAKKKLVAITHTQTGIVDTEGHFLFSAYVGSFFPVGLTANHIMVPGVDTNGNAVIKSAVITADNATLMPLTVTTHNIANIMSTLIGRPYGWGNTYFYNDCSGELKSLFAPFGIWLPRHSSDQVTVGKMTDMSAYPADQRLSYLMSNGDPLLTLIYVGGHVILYVGNDPNPNSGNAPMAMTYQDVWGLSPNPPIRRAVIGKSVLIPMLLQYPEDTTLTSFANHKYFQVSDLNVLPNMTFEQELVIDLRSLMGLKDR